MVCLSLALRELEATTGFLAAVFLTFDNTAVAGQEPDLFQGRTQVWLVIGQGLGQAVAHRTGLTRKSAASNVHNNVILTHAVGHKQRLLHDHPQHGAGEIGLERTLIDHNLARAGLDPDTGDSVFAFAGCISAPLFVELLHMFGGLSSRGRALEIGERCQRFSHDQSLLAFLRFKPAMSMTTGVWAVWGCSAPL